MYLVNINIIILLFSKLLQYTRISLLINNFSKVNLSHTQYMILIKRSCLNFYELVCFLGNMSDNES